MCTCERRNMQSRTSNWFVARVAMGNASEYKWPRKCQMPIADHKFLNYHQWHWHWQRHWFLTVNTPANLAGMGGKYLPKPQCPSFWLLGLWMQRIDNAPATNRGNKQTISAVPWKCHQRRISNKKCKNWKRFSCLVFGCYNYKPKYAQNRHGSVIVCMGWQLYVDL